MKDVLLLNPPPLTSRGFMKDICCGENSYVDAVFPPLSLAYVAGTLRNKKINLDLIDGNALELKLTELKEILLDKKYKILIINSSHSSFKSDIEISNYIKKILPKINIIFYGVYPTACWKEVIKEQIVDFVVRGEPEVTVLELVKNILNKNEDYGAIGGAVYKNNKKIIRNKERTLIKNLDEIPYPARDMLPIKKYKHPLFKPNSITLRTSRGCIYNCLFCGTKIINKRRWRAHSPERVVNEIKHIIESHNIKNFFLEDEQFFLDKERVKNICKKIINEKIKIKWAAMARTNLINNELLKIIKKAGCYRIDLGVESLNDITLKNIRKGINKKQTIDAIKKVKKAGLAVGVILMAGLPGDNTNSIRQSIKILKKNKVDCLIMHTATPYIGTDFYDLCKKKKWIINEDLNNYGTSCSVLSYPNFTKEEIEKTQLRCYKDFYLNPAYIFRQFFKISSFGDIKEKIRGVIELKNSIKRIN